MRLWRGMIHPESLLEVPHLTITYLKKEHELEL